MSTTTVVKPNTYIDSVSLMSISTKANELPGVQQAFVAMATPMNKEVLQSLDLITPEIEAATPGDLMLIAITDDGVNTDQTMADIEALLDRKPRSDQDDEATYKTIDQAADGRPDANLAVISVNGEYAAGQAHAALDRGMNVMIFSDNVSIEDELALKQKAHEKGLLMMGPDCGTAIIDGVGLCFATTIGTLLVEKLAAGMEGLISTSVKHSIPPFFLTRISKSVRYSWARGYSVRGAYLGSGA